LVHGTHELLELVCAVLEGEVALEVPQNSELPGAARAVPQIVRLVAENLPAHLHFVVHGLKMLLKSMAALEPSAGSVRALRALNEIVGCR